jgi:amino acid transporter
MSVVLLLCIYTLAVFAFQGVVPNKELQANSGNILAYIGSRLAGSFWSKVMILAVLGGTLASLQAAIVSSSRIAFAMGRDAVFPRWFAAVNPRTRTPWNATLLFGALNILFLWGNLEIGPIGNALSNIVSTLGLYAAIFYALTGAAAIWFYRRVITASGRNLAFAVLPAIGVAFLLYVIVYSLTNGVLNSVEIGFGVGLAVLGLALAVVSRLAGRSAYFETQPAAEGADPATEA